MTSPIDVSVVIAAWKAASFIERAVASALASTGVSVEVIVIDDASPDGTWDVIQRLAASDPRIVVERLAANAGQSVARNRAISRARGAFIAVLDADDAIEPDRLACMVAVANSSNADMVVDNMLEVSAAGQTLGLFLKSAPFEDVCDIDLEMWVRHNQPFEGFDGLGYLKPLFRREALARLGAAYDPSLRNSEDYYLVAHMLAAGARLRYTPEPGYRYTRAAGSTSHRLTPQQTRAWLTAEGEFQQTHRAGFKPTERRALKRRLKRLREVDQMISATHALKARRVVAFLRLLASDFTAARFTLRIFAGVALARLGGKPARSGTAA